MARTNRRPICKRPSPHRELDIRVDPLSIPSLSLPRPSLSPLSIESCAFETGHHMALPASHALMVCGCAAAPMPPPLDI